MTLVREVVAAELRHLLQPRVPAVPGARLRSTVATELADLLVGGNDDDPIGELDEQTLALLDAMAELEEEAGSRSWDPAKHPRDPVTGQFLSLVDRFKAAIKQHIAGGTGRKHPFETFSREQLRAAAKTRGITVQRGESRDSIAAKLLADLNKSTASPSASPGTPAAPSVTVKPGPNWANGSPTASVDVNGAPGGVVVHDANTGGYFPFTSTNTQKTALGNTVRIQPVNNGYKTQQDAIDAVARAYTPAKVSGPGLAGLKLSELRVEPLGQRWSSWHKAKSSFEISQNGSPIGTVSDFGYGWEATDSSGKAVLLPTAGFASTSTFKTKSEALKALVSTMPNPPAQAAAKSPAAPSLPQGSPHGPEIQGALDILYGNDPKSHTIARQLQVYGSLRKSQFDQLGDAEKQGVLADLSFIVHKSSSKNGTEASKLIDRFTPAGTKPGQLHKQAIHVPANVAANQTRVSDPAGTPDLLKMKPAGKRGKTGDGWTRTSSGGRGPWGQYGAAGLMLRHVDANGEERFLMVQRGPAISDPGMWQFPGGAKEEKEDFYQGATREVVEELGFKATDLDSARVHGTHTNEVPTVTVPGLKGGSVPWAYVSVAATVDKQLMPDLSTPHARAETADAKWMTRAEIDKLDTKGKLLKPLAGGALQQNVLTLFPGTQPQSVPAPASVTKRPPRLTGNPTVSKPKTITHKPSIGRDLISDTASRDKLRQDVKNARKAYAGKAADDRLAAIGAMQGFDDVPTVVAKDEFERLLATGDYLEAWRGVRGAGSYSGPTRGGAVSRTKTAAEIQEQFRSGPAYYGNGIYGNGYYFATDKSVAKGYADGTKGSLLRVLIPKKAKMVAHSTIRSEAQTNAPRFSKAKGKSHEEATLWDEGRYAAAKGHDMIKITSNIATSSVATPNKPAFNILNRSILIVEEAS